MFIAEHKGELLNSKCEWRQPSIIRNVIVSGGVEMARGGLGTGFLGIGGQMEVCGWIGVGLWK